MALSLCLCLCLCLSVSVSGAGFVHSNKAYKQITRLLLQVQYSKEYVLVRWSVLEVSSIVST